MNDNKQVVTIHPFESEEEVIEYANDSQYGLSCSVWSENGKRARRVAEAIQVGTVWVNCWMVRDLRMPFGGTKKSGKQFYDSIQIKKNYYLLFVYLFI